MRHFLIRQLGRVSLAVPRLPRRLKAPSSMRDAVRGSGSPLRFTPLCLAALQAEALTPIASAAKTKLNTATPAAREPVLR
jgi:hypothetical protein